MIEVFKTNIQGKIQSEAIRQQILKQYPQLKIDFDLDDIDKVLRVEGNFFNAYKIAEIVILNGFECKILM